VRSNNNIIEELVVVVVVVVEFEINDCGGVDFRLFPVGDREPDEDGMRQVGLF